MNGYLLSLLGVILLGVLIDVILPSGSTSKYISGIFAIVVMFVMVSPLLKFINSDNRLNNYFTAMDIQLNEKLLYNISNSKFNAVEDAIKQELVSNGYNNVNIEVEFKVVADSVEIRQVLVDLTNLVINTNSANINKYVYIRQVVMQHLAVTEEVIVFCE